MGAIFDKIKIFFGFEEEEKELPEINISKQNAESTKDLVLKGFKGKLINNPSNLSQISEIRIEEPRIYEDSLNIATHLRQNKPVIVNLKSLDKLSSKRLIDFVCGTAYAINGHMIKIGENIFLFSPENIIISSSDEKSPFQQGVEADEQQVFFNKAVAIN